MNRITLKELLEGKFKNYIPKWFNDLILSQKCNWIADSKGGEPNHRSE